MIRAFKEIFGITELFVPEEFALMGAIGAALKDMPEKQGPQYSWQRAMGEGQWTKTCEYTNTFDLQKLENFINSGKLSENGHNPLINAGDDFIERHLKGSKSSGVMSYGSNERKPSPITHHPSPPLRAYLCVDIGSISTNLAVIDESCNLIAKRYLMIAGRPIEAVRQGLEEIYSEVGDRIEIAGVGTTGSGRYMIADYIIEMQIGPARFTADPKSQAARRPFEHRLIVRETRFRLPPGRRAPKVQELYAALAADEKRNEMVLNDAIARLEERRSPLLLTERRDHLETLPRSCGGSLDISSCFTAA